MRLLSVWGWSVSPGDLVWKAQGGNESQTNPPCWQYSCRSNGMASSHLHEIPESVHFRNELFPPQFCLSQQKTSV